MAVELIWSPRARDDLLDIYLSIALEHPKAAERYLRRIEAKVSLLVDQPRLGVRRPDIRRATRLLVEVPYLILYETVPRAESERVTTVRIVRVVDGRRDLTSIF